VHFSKYAEKSNESFMEKSSGPLQTYFQDGKSAQTIRNRRTRETEPEENTREITLSSI
jgi:hypothetical protein